MKEFTDIFDGVLQLAPAPMLALAINFLLMWIKKVPKMPDWPLPLLAMLIGGFVYPFIAEVGKVSYNVKSPTAFLIMVGIGIGGISVACHQVFKRVLKRIGMSTGDTIVYEKDSTNSGS